MTPTPEQVAQWARDVDAFFDVMAFGRHDGILFTPDEINRLVTRAMAEQAEADAKLCDGESAQWNYCAAAIRANAPKVTT